MGYCFSVDGDGISKKSFLNFRIEGEMRVVLFDIYY